MKEIIEKYKRQIEEALHQLKTPGLRKKQIPNILTASRLLSPFIIIPSIVTGNFMAAGISTLLFSVTDLFDGLLARKMKVTSDLGKDLDAATDKIFIGTLMLSLVITNVIYLLPFVMEGLISSINITKKLKNKNPETSMVGKVKMTSLYILVSLGFLNMYVNIPPILFNVLYPTTIGLQALTIQSYCRDKSKRECVKDKDIEEKNSTEKIENNEKEKTMTEKHLEKYKFYKKIIEEQKNKELLDMKQEKKEPEKVKTKK